MQRTRARYARIALRRGVCASPSLVLITQRGYPQWWKRLAPRRQTRLLESSGLHHGRHLSAFRSIAAGGAAEGSSGPLVLRPLMKRPVDPVTEGVGGFVCECLFQVAEDDADQKVLLPRLRPEAADR